MFDSLQSTGGLQQHLCDNFTGKLSRWQFCAFVEPSDKAAAAANANHGVERFASLEAFVKDAQRIEPVAAVVDLRRLPHGVSGTVRQHCESEPGAVCAGPGRSWYSSTQVLFIEAPVELALLAGGVDLAECLRLLASAGYVTKHAPMNPNAWGTPVDGDRELIIATASEAARAVDFAAYEVPCQPFAVVKRFKCVKDVMEFDVPAKLALRATRVAWQTQRCSGRRVPPPRRTP